MIGRIVEGLTSLGIQPQDDNPHAVGIISQNAILGAALAPGVMADYVKRVLARHEDCPSDCIMTGLQFTLELLLAAQTLDREHAAPLEAQWRNEQQSLDFRLGMFGRWSSWVVLATVIGEPRPKILKNGGHVSSLCYMLGSLGDAWPGMAADTFGTMLDVTAPDTIEGVES